jgi:hypothetical protein
MRMPANAEQLRHLVEAQYGGVATLLYAVPVRHVTGELLWEGVVHVLELDRNPDATEAYAWTCPFDGEDHAMLRSGCIRGPADAVRAALQTSGWGPDFKEKRL